MQDSGVCYFNMNNHQIERIKISNNWTYGTVLEAKIVNKNDLIIATEKNGLILFLNERTYQYKYIELIQTANINQFYLDKTHQIWLASKNGLSQFIEKRFSIINKEKGLSDERILALAVDNYNKLWIGTTMGISKIDNINGNDIIETKIQDLSKFTISCATKAPDGNIWFGTYGNGIVIVSTETHQSVILNTKDDQLSNDNISGIYFANDTTVYISTLGSGLIEAHVELKGKAKLFKIDKLIKEENGLGNNYVYSVITDKKGKLYVATDGGGLNVIEKKGFVDIAKKHHLNSNTFFSLCCDKNNHIWATSNIDGIIKYDGQKIKTFNKSNGIRDLQPQQIIILNNSLYAINSKGIDRIDIETDIVTNSDFSDKDIEPNLNAICLYENKILSGTNTGLLIYRTTKNYIDSIKPKVAITDLLINFKPFSIDSAFSFNYKQNNISLSFKGIWLKNPDKLYYRYRLYGFEDNWNYSDEGKNINYNNLNPGNYSFVVQVKNDEEIWSDPETYSFIILTPIWKRIWFWPSLLLLLVVGIYFFVKIRLKALHRENLILEQKVLNRTKEIEKQSKIIEAKNKDITDSISYAQKIQHAILPNQNVIKKHLPSSFILYLTKDIVSGDFYFFTHFENQSIIASVDCTGHGVPGAFMSLIGSNLLNQIINENKITNPKEILFELNKGVLNALHKNDNTSKDGMDIAICKINHTDLSLEYAGAMRPLWIVCNGELSEIKADKIPIGTKPSDRNTAIEYTTHLIPHNKNNTFYIFTDGYADQFGGDNDKKYSTARLKNLLIENSNQHFDVQEKNIKDSHLKWKGHTEQVDDILVIGFSI